MLLSDIAKKTDSFFRESYNSIKSKDKFPLIGSEHFLITATKIDAMSNFGYKVDEIYDSTKKEVSEILPDNYTITTILPDHWEPLVMSVHKHKELGYLICVNRSGSSISDFDKHANIMFAVSSRKVLDKINRKETLVAKKQFSIPSRKPSTMPFEFKFFSEKSYRYETERIIGEPLLWHHSWEVMGHWRNVNGLGKDRNGQYILNGKTWVKPCIKGNGELIKKTRIIR